MKRDTNWMVLAIIAFIAFVIIIGITALLRPQSLTRQLGGDTTITLDPGLKLEEITWKEDSLWYLTRPMREDETAETHTFQQSSNFGVFEGTVTIIEHDMTTGEASDE